MNLHAVGDSIGFLLSRLEVCTPGPNCATWQMILGKSEAVSGSLDHLVIYDVINDRCIVVYY